MASVKVAVRVRPFNKRELDLKSKLIVEVSGNQIVLLDHTTNSLINTGRRENVSAEKARAQQHQFAFDYSYWSHEPNDAHFVDQEQVFLDLGTDVVENAFEGYNACVFAYGQTGSGKTFTMMGSENNRGLIPRICQTMFQKMQSGKEDLGTTYRTEVSYLEIYNEKVKDLLSRKDSSHNLRVREHPALGPYVENLSKHLVMDYEEILTLMERGNEIRTTACTNMNDTSSRSHAIFTITFVNAGFFQGVPHETVSKIHLVDLAGSERADATGATGQRLKEGAHINKSLVTLGSVISALADASNKEQQQQPKKNVFIPYRDSVLTWLLKDSLGGNSKTIMIATISPAEVNQSETLSTLRYANRAKNIINKPTVNEDPNVRLIRELRDEIERLRSMMSLDPVTLSTVQRQLAVKEAQERHLTEEWTGKWKEAANILKEQRALALKRTTGLGVILDSDKPHLVGVDEDVLSTGITLYHLKDGDTVIGGRADQCDIVLKGPCIEDTHCTVHLAGDGAATLVPAPGALCMVNASLVSEPVKLSQGCVVVLGKTNMFRYNDPKEAESMRRLHNNNNNKASDKLSQHQQQNRSLLSNSLSDLRHTMGQREAAKLHASEGNIREFGSGCPTAAEESMSHSSDLAGSLKDLDNNNCSDESGKNITVTGQSSTTSSEEMNDLYKCICEQKNIIMSCLETETCDIGTLNKQIAVLQGMQDAYSKLEYELARALWINSQHEEQHQRGVGDGRSSFDEQFSAMVEQEVDRRIFQEKVLRAESEFHEREMLRMQKEREVDEIRRQHEKEVYLLKRKLHEASAAAALQQQQQTALESPLSVRIPAFHIAQTNGKRFVEFEVIIAAKDESWTVSRRFRRFRELHLRMVDTYGPSVHSLNFPSRRLMGSTSEGCSLERQRQLQIYLHNLFVMCSSMPLCPLYLRPLKSAVIEFSDFFAPTANDGS